MRKTAQPRADLAEGCCLLSACPHPFILFDANLFGLRIPRVRRRGCRHAAKGQQAKAAGVQLRRGGWRSCQRPARLAGVQLRSCAERAGAAAKRQPSTNLPARNGEGAGGTAHREERLRKNTHSVALTRPLTQSSATLSPPLSLSHDCSTCHAPTLPLSISRSLSLSLSMSICFFSLSPMI